MTKDTDTNVANSGSVKKTEAGQTKIHKCSLCPNTYFEFPKDQSNNLCWLCKDIKQTMDTIRDICDRKEDQKTIENIEVMLRNTKPEHRLSFYEFVRVLKKEDERLPE